MTATVRPCVGRRAPSDGIEDSDLRPEVEQDPFDLPRQKTAVARLPKRPVENQKPRRPRLLGDVQLATNALDRVDR